LHVPIYDDENGRRASLRDAEIIKILESEGELVIVVNLHQGRRCPEAHAEAPDMSTSLCYGRRGMKRTSARRKYANRYMNVCGDFLYCFRSFWESEGHKAGDASVDLFPANCVK
jgi:hypothetical protein